MAAKRPRHVRNPDPGPIDQEEWDFSKCPPNEADYCWYYERARHDERIKARVAELRNRASSKAPVSSLSGELGEALANLPELQKVIVERHTGANVWIPDYSPADAEFYRELWFLTFFKLFVEFPKTPWLKIPAKARQDRCNECRLLKGPFLEVSPERLDMAQEYPSVPLDTGLGSIHTVHTVEIDWTMSNEAIFQAFERWVSARRPCKKATGRQGGRTNADRLKLLGTYRLLVHFNGDYEAARDYEPLYRDQSAWIKARKSALQLLKHEAIDIPRKNPFGINFAALEPEERADIKVFIMKYVDRAMARRLRKIGPLKALEEIRTLMKMAQIPLA